MRFNFKSKKCKKIWIYFINTIIVNKKMIFFQNNYTTTQSDVLSNTYLYQITNLIILKINLT